MSVHWATDESILNKKNQFDQAWMIVKELKDCGESIYFRSLEDKYSFEIDWNGEFYALNCNFKELLDDYEAWSKKRANQVNH